jgi:hypothetical protein
MGLCRRLGLAPVAIQLSVRMITFLEFKTLERTANLIISRIVILVLKKNRYRFADGVFPTFGVMQEGGRTLIVKKDKGRLLRRKG